MTTALLFAVYLNYIMPENVFPGDRFAGNLRHGVGVIMMPAVANCLPSPFAARKKLRR
ncbi:hypothetical protein LAD67_17670 [Escherichia coli]|nr:hypothetical protein [Escherichia coli]